MARALNENQLYKRSLQGLGGHGQVYSVPDRDRTGENPPPRRNPQPTPNPTPTPTPPPNTDTDDPNDPWANFSPGVWTGQGPPIADLVAPRGTKEWRRAVNARREWEGAQLHRLQALGQLIPEDPESLANAMRQIGLWEFKPDNPNQTSHKWKLWQGMLPEEGFGMTQTGAGSINPTTGQPNMVNVPQAYMTYMPPWKQGLHQALQGGHLLPDRETGLYVNPGPGGDMNNPGWYDMFGNPTTAPYTGAWHGANPVNNTPTPSGGSTFEWSEALGGPKPEGWNNKTGTVNKGLGSSNPTLSGGFGSSSDVSAGPGDGPISLTNNLEVPSSAGGPTNPSQKKSSRVKSLFGEPVQWTPMA